ncbi:hypothetical protein HHL16_22645 [Pseudoflavitalea sp. G-6-1-2]|uniref:MutS-related protein n=1 Tax=Pseudoflavitalea sp. G-6-1-2 TaxID=2728841 RepID=UPI00146C6F8E|nr:hypothetical protein [Pseudoflavitalea sp. G-6-1-2]NML23697.1 hypothetical protein [Pseudoflavitalea sp. G-6-1-2]
MNPLEYYQQRITTLQQRLKQLHQQLLWVSMFRLLSFLGVAATGYYYFRNDKPTWLLGITVSILIIFIMLVRKAFKLNDDKALTTKLLFVNTNEAAMLQQQPSQFPDGREAASEAGYAADLDIFGKGSLYHLLNRTTTSHGTEKLQKALLRPDPDAASIRANQQAIQQMAGQRELRQLLTANGLLHGEKEGNLHDVLAWLQMPTVLQHIGWIRIVRWALPVLSIIGFIVVAFTMEYTWLVPGILISWVVTGLFAKKILHQHNLLSKKQSILEQYGTILQLFSSVETGDAAVLIDEKKRAQSANKSISQLSSLSGMFDQRLNLLVNLFLNSFFLYDIQCMYALDKWKTNHKEQFDEWIDGVGAIETLNSFATFSFNNPDFIQPEVSSAGEPQIAATAMAHPLIPAGSRVANDFTIGEAEKLMLVTGSNMSGKTTFLRTIGINLLLAQCGAPVCAASFRFTPMNILSSIRVSDSLQEHTSYFMAELKQLQQIIHFLQAQQAPSLILIDEILRGTNSEDKTHGSEQFIRKLLQYNCVTLFATHDLALSILEEELKGRVSNYCFESIIRDGQLLFDYTLQRGVAKNKNASFLMKKMEII